MQDIEGCIIICIHLIPTSTFVVSALAVGLANDSALAASLRRVGRRDTNHRNPLLLAQHGQFAQNLWVRPSLQLVVKMFVYLALLIAIPSSTIFNAMLLTVVI